MHARASALRYRSIHYIRRCRSFTVHGKIRLLGKVYPVPSGWLKAFAGAKKLVPIRELEYRPDFAGGH